MSQNSLNIGSSGSIDPSFGTFNSLNSGNIHQQQLQNSNNQQNSLVSPSSTPLIFREEQNLSLPNIPHLVKSHSMGSTINSSSSALSPN